MKKINLLIVIAVLLISACSKEKKQRGRIDYDLIKEKAGITGSTAEKFDAITAEHSKKSRELFEKNKANNTETPKEEREKIAHEQDAEIKKILTEEQFLVYSQEIKIERTGREKHNMGLIKEALKLDSVQTIAFDQTNAAFYKTLRDHHDSYHGKPDVYKQFYAELDVSRKDALKKVLTEEQYQTYLTLVEKYQIGKRGER